MIVGLHGQVIYQTPTALWVQTQGIVYEVFVPLRILAQQLSAVQLFTTHIVREDAMSLYGFLELDEKIFFDRVIRISGIGPKVGLAILSTYTPSEFLAHLHDSKAIQKVPGIGPKSAGLLRIELEGFFIANAQPNIRDARLALEALGFKSDKIQQALAAFAGSSLSTQDIIKESLKKL